MANIEKRHVYKYYIFAGIPQMSEVMPAMARFFGQMDAAARSTFQLAFHLQMETVVLALLGNFLMSQVEGKSTFLLLLLPFGFVLLPYLFVAYGHRLPDRRLAVLVICLIIGLASGHRAALGQRAHPGVALVTAAGFYLATKFVSLNARPVVTVCGLAIGAALLFVLGTAFGRLDSKVTWLVGTLALLGALVDWQLKLYLHDIGRFDRANSALFVTVVTFLLAYLLNFLLV